MPIHNNAHLKWHPSFVYAPRHGTSARLIWSSHPDPCKRPGQLHILTWSYILYGMQCIHVQVYRCIRILLQFLSQLLSKIVTKWRYQHSFLLLTSEVCVLLWGACLYIILVNGLNSTYNRKNAVLVFSSCRKPGHIVITNGVCFCLEKPITLCYGIKFPVTSVWHHCTCTVTSLFT